MFADDIMVDMSSSDSCAINSGLSNAVSGLARHLRSRGLILNESKTQILGIHAVRGKELVMNVNCEGTPLTQTKTAKYLGIVLDDKLNWKAQISSVIQKVSFKLSRLWRIRSSLPLEVAVMLHRALLISNQMYGSNAYWSNLPAAQLDRLVKLDKRCVRFAAGVPPLTHTAPLYRKLGLCPTWKTAQDKLKVLAYRCHTHSISPLIYSRIVPLCQVSRIMTRGVDQGNFLLPSATTSHGISRPLFQAALLWNDLPADIKSCKSASAFAEILAVA